ncbi:hypothetical protein PR370_01895 [Mycobacterium marinum]|uniref:hypothetical protein n=1 Tax=Mycobacterium marinum TaxID=1781 RepID=UPI000EC59A38|nr:hypothetical protein [Mycobacterium marinum]MDC8980508.1 hypothetical protein [Mycobacterium marinum]MDC8998058.1 hypothetical protein [Mycobacterium marinum]MDC9008798.1 hypothetical protein [Mycobacterium marinum]RFZ70465.1 hypothetical protein DE4576_00358 [Mycobacterium marinum]
MKVIGVKDANFEARQYIGSPRVFIRMGFQRYAATADEADELARQLVAAAQAVRDAAG